MIHDRKTVEYFNRETPEYSLERFHHIIEFLKDSNAEGSVLADVGCGCGNILEYLSINAPPLKNIIGIDVSENYLEQVRARLDCDTYCGSILDRDFISSLNLRCDFVILGALLHHLIGMTRKSSMEYAQKSLENSLILLKNGGYLIVHEPAFSPPRVMTLVFWIKKLLSSVFSGRINIFGYWNNIGAPVVSFYSNEQLVRLFSCVKDCKLVDMHIEDTPVSTVQRCCLIRRRTDSTYILQKTG